MIMPNNQNIIPEKKRYVNGYGSTEKMACWKVYGFLHKQYYFIF